MAVDQAHRVIVHRAVTENLRFRGERAFDLAFYLSAPSNHAGRKPILIRRANRQDAGLAALGQGWPFAAARRINVGFRVCRA